MTSAVVSCGEPFARLTSPAGEVVALTVVLADGRVGAAIYGGDTALADILALLVRVAGAIVICPRTGQLLGPLSAAHAPNIPERGRFCIVTAGRNGVPAFLVFERPAGAAMPVVAIETGHLELRRELTEHAQRWTTVADSRLLAEPASPALN